MESDADEDEDEDDKDDCRVAAETCFAYYYDIRLGRDESVEAVVGSDHHEAAAGVGNHHRSRGGQTAVGKYQPGDDTAAEVEGEGEEGDGDGGAS